MGLVCARRTRPISGSASDYEGLSGDGSAGGPQEDFAGRARYDLAIYGITMAIVGDYMSTIVDFR